MSSLLGTTLDDRYRIQTELGRGASCVVYEGMHVGLRRRVAIKVLDSRLAAESAAVTRFFREARTVSQLGGRHIVQVHDLGYVPDGRPYLVMDRVEGRSLAQELFRVGSMTLGRTLHLLEGVADALMSAHREGIVHRDVKPENLVLAGPDGGAEGSPNERLTLLDFGIAAFCHPGPNERLTSAGVLVGTPAYMAPETAYETHPHPVGDVYSLAVVAFEMLTGQVPIYDDDPMRLLLFKCDRPAPTLQQVSGVRYPEAVETAIGQGLARDPSERFETPAAFVNALREAKRIVLESESRYAAWAAFTMPPLAAG